MLLFGRIRWRLSGRYDCALATSASPRPTVRPSARARGGFLPDAEQELLLRAALATGDDAIRAWEAWRLRFDLDDIDGGSCRLLPQVYRNLVRNGWSGRELPRLKGLYRQTWYRNQILERRLSEVVLACQARGIETLVLKGAALIRSAYQDPGLRPMDDADVLVPLDRAVEALHLLGELGYGPRVRHPEGLVAVRHSAGLRNRDGQEIDLHWHLLWSCFRESDDAPFWKESVPLEIGAAATRSLSPTHALLHVLSHGAMWNRVPPIRWVADAMTLYAAAARAAVAPDLQWASLGPIAERYGVVLPLRTTLDYLRRAFSLPVPYGLLARLHAYRPSAVERLDHAVRTHPQQSLGALAALGTAYLRWACATDSLPAPVGLLGYVARSWDLESPRLVPRVAWTRLSRRLMA